jgi:hypothetical protein
MKQRELMVKDMLDAHGKLCLYTQYDTVLPCAPTNRRPDFVYIPVSTQSEIPIVILEVDEDYHRYYNTNCELVRILEMHEALGGRPLHIIRFNPLKRLLHRLRDYLCDYLQTCQRQLSPIVITFLGYPDDKKYDFNRLEHTWITEEDIMTAH